MVSEKAGHGGADLSNVGVWSLLNVWLFSFVISYGKTVGLMENDRIRLLFILLLLRNINQLRNMNDVDSNAVSTTAAISSVPISDVIAQMGMFVLLFPNLFHFLVIRYTLLFIEFRWSSQTKAGKHEFWAQGIRVANEGARSKVVYC